MEDPEETFRNQSDLDVAVERELGEVPATEELADALGVSEGESISHVVTRAIEDDRPISISDTYSPRDVVDTSEAAFLEETIADRLPTPAHAAWLRTDPGDLVKQVRQRFTTADGRVIMVCQRPLIAVTRYDAFRFRMALNSDAVTTDSD